MPATELKASRRPQKSCGETIIRVRKESGEGEIRTPETLAGLPVFKTDAVNSQAASVSEVTERGESVLPSSLSKTPQNRPDSAPVDDGLKLVIERWRDLPEAVRAGIAAMVTAWKV